MAIEQDNAVPNSVDPGNNTIYVNNQKTLDSLKTKIQSLEKDMENEMAVFHEYETRYNKDSADFLLEFADNVKSIDRNIRDEEKVLNSVEYYRNNYNNTFKQTWKLESREMAYVGLLEMASLLDTQNAKTPATLGQIYKNAGEDMMAISCFEKAIQYNNAAADKMPDKELLSIYKNLGALYYATNRYVDSAWYYEKAYTMEKDPEMEFQLAKIHAEKTGNYKRALELLEDLAQTGNRTAIANAEVPSPETLKNKFQLMQYIAATLEKTESVDKLEDYLSQLVEIHVKFEKLISDSYDVLRNNEKKMMDAKIRLNQKPDQTALQTFYQAQQNYNAQKETTQKLEAARKALNLRKLYFTLAYQNELRNNFPGAIDVYRRAESFGIDPDQARREIQRLQKIYQDK